MASGDSDHPIIYDPATGAPYYDAVGNGAGAAVQFATLGTNLALTNADFVGGPQEQATRTATFGERGPFKRVEPCRRLWSY